MSPITLDRRLREVNANSNDSKFEMFTILDEETGRVETVVLNMSTLDVFTLDEYENLVARADVRRRVRENLIDKKVDQIKRVVEEEPSAASSSH